MLVITEVYIGHPNAERYGQYETRTLTVRSNALDIPAEFCTQTNVENGTGFDIHRNNTESEVEIIKQQLTNWRTKRL